MRPDAKDGPETNPHGWPGLSASLKMSHMNPSVLVLMPLCARHLGVTAYLKKKFVYT